MINEELIEILVPWQKVTNHTWNLSQVKFHYDVVLGKMLQNSANSPADLQVPYLKAQHVQWDSVVLDNLPTMWANPNEVDSLRLKRGDLLVCEGGEAGRAAILEGNPPENCIIQNALHLVRPKEAEDLRFLRYTLQHASSQKWLEVLSSRATIAHFTSENFKGLWLWLPPKNEQSAIADFLDEKTAVIDHLITAKERLLTLLDEKRRALITHAVTRGLDTAVPLRDSGVEWIGRVPQHWEIASIKYTAEVGNGSTPKRDNKDYWDNGTFPWLTSTVVNDNIVQEPTQFVTELALRECHLPIVPARSVLVAITGQGKTRGNAALLPYQATINQHMVYISPRQRILNPEYLNNYLFGVYEVLRMISEGSGSTRGAITVQQIAEFPILLPPVVEQQEIVHYLEGWTHHFVRPVFRDVRPTLQDARRKKRDGFETRVPLFATQDPNSGTSVPKNETPPIIGLVLAPVN